MKLIRINESQRRRLFEAYNDGFSFKELSSIGRDQFDGEDNTEKQLEYCRKYLGEPDNFGSSRCVFTLDDNTVLKLAYDKRDAGIAQNEREYTLSDSPLFPRIYGHDSRFTYLIVEAVLPARSEDFERILGIPFDNRFRQNSVKGKDQYSKNGGDTDIGFNKYFDNIRKPYESYGVCMYDILDYITQKYILRKPGSSKYYDSIIKNSDWLTNLVKAVKKTKLCDINKMNNYGIVNRNGKEELVLLDSGFTRDVFHKFYK